MTPRTDSARRARRRIRRRLLERWARDIANWLHCLREAPPTESETAKDIEDDAADNRTRQLEYALAQKRSETLRGIQDALQRLENGRYGICDDCAAEIPEPRLRALPFASVCHRCQAERETTRPWIAPPARRIVFEPRAFQTDEEPTAAQAARRRQAVLGSAA